MEWNKDSLAWLEVASGICFAALALCVGKANTLGNESHCQDFVEWSAGIAVAVWC